MDIPRLKKLANVNESVKDKPYVGHIEDATVDNTFYRNVLSTTSNIQLVLMSLKAGEEIGSEVHKDTDQFIRVEEGTCKFVLDDKEHTCKAGDAVIVPKGTKHNVINTGSELLKLYTIYSPPQHKPGTKEKTKKEE